MQPDAIEGTLIAHIYDVAHDLNVEPIGAAARSGRRRHVQRRTIVRMLSGGLEIAADGRVLTADLVGARDRRGSAIAAAARPLHASIAHRARSRLPRRSFRTIPSHQTFVNIYEGDTLTQAILDRGKARFEYFAGSRQGVLAVIRRFVPAGIHHILIGPDHLLFLVGLLLLGGTIRQLALVVTSFTVAHSITLSLAALNIVSPPARIIEPAIALSIVYVGADNLLVHGGRDVRAWIAFAFGFIHGFGFANVLREMDLPARALGWSLFSFNFGVEIGQLLVVLVVASAFAVLRARSETAGRRLVFAGSIVVVAAGTFWFVQRVFFPGGM